MLSKNAYVIVIFFIFSELVFFSFTEEPTINLAHISTLSSFNPMLQQLKLNNLYLESNEVSQAIPSILTGNGPVSSLSRSVAGGVGNLAFLIPGSRGDRAAALSKTVRNGVLNLTDAVMQVVNGVGDRVLERFPADGILNFDEYNKKSVEDNQASINIKLPDIVSTIAHPFSPNPNLIPQIRLENFPQVISPLVTRQPSLYVEEARQNNDPNVVLNKEDSFVVRDITKRLKQLETLASAMNSFDVSSTNSTQKADKLLLSDIREQQHDYLALLNNLKNTTSSSTSDNQTTIKNIEASTPRQVDQFLGRLRGAARNVLQFPQRLT